MMTESACEERGERFLAKKELIGAASLFPFLGLSLAVSHGRGEKREMRERPFAHMTAPRAALRRRTQGMRIMSCMLLKEKGGGTKTCSRNAADLPPPPLPWHSRLDLFIEMSSPPPQS